MLLHPSQTAASQWEELLTLFAQAAMENPSLLLQETINLLGDGVTPEDALLLLNHLDASVALAQLAELASAAEVEDLPNQPPLTAARLLLQLIDPNRQ